MKRVFLPFDLPAFAEINSNHPLPVSLTRPSYDGIEFVRAGTDPAPPGAAVATLRRAIAFVEELQGLVKGPPLTDGALLAFVATRDLVSQARFDTTADLAFCHTAPMLLNQMPYLLHIENIATLFYPSLEQGSNRNTELHKAPIFWLVRAMLEAPACRGIFTNLRRTKAQIDRVFASDVLSRKTRHIPAGPYFGPDEIARVVDGLARKRDKKEVEILFTNSWHQHAPNFVLRGGVDLVMAFLNIAKQCPNLRLILRTTWPEGIDPELTKAVHEHPQITLLPKMLSEDEILDLFIRADIFFLDAASVHSVSLLRAMYCGAVCVVSDAPGYEEYVTHGETAIVTPGRQEKIYTEDPSSGWLRCDFSSMYKITQPRIDLLAGIISWLYTNREARLTLSANARAHVLQHNNFAAWRDGFEAALREALVAPA
jgi:glycosyltransferase involved in cell wall biosynthesis